MERARRPAQRTRPRQRPPAASRDESSSHPHPLLDLQRQAGNASTSQLIVQRDAHGGVLDNGRLVRDVHENGRTYRAGCYVEVIHVEADGRLRVRVFSGHGGRGAVIHRSWFVHEPQAPNRTDDDGTSHGNRDDVMYSSAAGPLMLWDSRLGPRPEDINQGGIGDCQLLSMAMGIASVHPEQIKALFPDPRLVTTSCTVVLHDPTPGNGSRRRAVRVDASILTDLRGALVGAQPGEHWACWPMFLEKAMAELAGGVDDLDEVTHDAAWYYTMITGRPAVAGEAVEAVPGTPTPQQWNTLAPGVLIGTMHRAIAEGDTITVGTKEGPTVDDDHVLLDSALHIVANHEYLVSAVNVDGQLIKLRNPWGHEHPARALTVSELKRYFNQMALGSG